MTNPSLLDFALFTLPVTGLLFFALVITFEFFSFATFSRFYYLGFNRAEILSRQLKDHRPFQTRFPDITIFRSSELELI
jgi:hypothetical protein